MSLPALSVLSKAFQQKNSSLSKQERTGKILRETILKYRTAKSLPFYTMRSLATAFGVSLKTVQEVFSRLEAEGFLLSVRASRTVMLGTHQPPKAHVAGIVGLPMWLLGLRYFGQYKAFSRLLGDMLWKQHIVVDTIPFWEMEDRKPDFFDRLLRHQVDFTVWLQPFRHNRETILKLRDHGIRNLLICDEELCPLPADIVLDWEPAYQNILRHWKKEYKIRRLILIEGEDYSTARSKRFLQIAEKEGFDCATKPMSRSLPEQLLKNLKTKNPLGIVIVDELTTAKFTFYNPSAFLELAARHRMFFSRGMLNTPFVEMEKLTIERAVAPAEILAETSIQLLNQWRIGESPSQPVKVAASHMIDWKLNSCV